MPKPKRHERLMLTLRQPLTEGEAAILRAFVASLRPRVYLIQGGSPYVEVRGLSVAQVAEVRERVKDVRGWRKKGK